MKTSHPLQSEAWGSFRRAMGIDVIRLGDWQLTFHNIPFTPFTIGYFPKGPKPDKRMLHELIKLGKQKHAIFIQLEPNVPASHQLTPSEIGTRAISLGARDKSNQLIPSHHPLFTKYTFVFDLTKSEEELLQAMHPKTRYNIRVAQKHGVIIKEDSSPQAFQAYLALTRETTRRQGFYAHNEAYHRSMWHIMKKAGIAHLFTASYQGSTLAAWIIFAWQDTVYYPYGASSREYRDVMAPNLLLWEIARWAKSKGYKKFDLWGSLGPHPDEHDPWYGFHRFKQGFNPTLVEFVGSYDLILNPFLYRLYTLADKVRWKLMR